MFDYTQISSFLLHNESIGVSPQGENRDYPLEGIIGVFFSQK